MQNEAVFLDRDGVLNEVEIRDGKPFAPRRADDFRLIPGSRESVIRLKNHGFLIIVVTNQPDIGNGLAQPSEIEAMHRQLRDLIPVDEIHICPHKQTENCECRKPRPGMLLAAMQEQKIDLKRSWMIGDRTSDVEAGKRAGCLTAFIDRNYAIETTEPGATITVSSLSDAVDTILAFESGAELKI